MPKTDKELAVELACAYISAWFTRTGSHVQQPLTGQQMADIVRDAYSAVSSLPNAESGT